MRKTDLVLCFSCDLVVFTTDFAFPLAKLVNDVEVNCGLLSVTTMHGHPWRAKCDLSFLTTVDDFVLPSTMRSHIRLSLVQSQKSQVINKRRSAAT